MKRGYIISPVNGKLISRYDKTFYIEYLQNTHPFVKDKFGCVHFSGYCRQMWINIDALKKYGAWLEPYIVGHERAHIYWYHWSHRDLHLKEGDEKYTETYFEHEKFMEKRSIEFVKNICEDDIYNKCLNFYIKRIETLERQRIKYVKKNVKRRNESR